MARYCDHQFAHIRVESKFDENNDPQTHAIIACYYCGQVRHVYEDGRVLIVKEEGEVKKAYGHSNPTTNKTQ